MIEDRHRRKRPARDVVAAEEQAFAAIEACLHVVPALLAAQLLAPALGGDPQRALAIPRDGAARFVGG